MVGLKPLNYNLKHVFGKWSNIARKKQCRHRNSALLNIATSITCGSIEEEASEKVKLTKIKKYLTWFKIDEDYHFLVQPRASNCCEILVRE